MNPVTHLRRPRLMVAGVVVGAALAAALVGVGLCGLVVGPAPAGRPAGSATGRPSPNPIPTIGLPDGPEPAVAGSDPETFARQVAVALFTWDTTAGEPADYAQLLVNVADDTEADALINDVYSYLPTAQAWAGLRTRQTRQWLIIDRLAVPHAWAIARQQAVPGQLPASATAYTIDGARHRSGIWGTQTLTTARPVAFTVFLACPTSPAVSPTGPCRLLRISRLDAALR